MRRAKVAWGHTLQRIGGWMPASSRHRVAVHFPSLKRRFNPDGDIIVPNYLGSFKVNLRRGSASTQSVLSGKLDADVLHAVEEFVRDGQVAVDIGANVGLVSLLLGKKVGKGGRVHAFEPGPPFFARLKRNIALNREYKSVFSLYRVGLSDQGCVLKWQEDPHHPGRGSLQGPLGTEVPVTTLDEVIQGGWQRLDFIKVEVEGMEGEVLRGAAKTLQRYRPVILFESLMEFEQYRGTPVRKELALFLKGLGYQLFQYTPGGKRVPTDYPYLSENTVAVPF